MDIFDRENIEFIMEILFIIIPFLFLYISIYCLWHLYM